MHAQAHVHAQTCMHTTDDCNLAHAKTQQSELGLSWKDLAAGIKRTVTAVLNAALDLYILVPV